MDGRKTSVYFLNLMRWLRLKSRKKINGHPVELIAFDWDGTLMDSAGAIARCIQRTAIDLGESEPTDGQARYVIGLGLVDALRHAMPGLSESRYSEAVERYRYHYLAQDHELLPFDGIAKLIMELSERGYFLGIATGKSRRGLERALEHSGLGSFFQATRCADECHSKPHPQMLEELMDEFGVLPERTLMIGDTTHDLLMAKNARTHGLAVTYGAHSRSALETELPVSCVETVEELSAWLLENA